MSVPDLPGVPAVLNSTSSAVDLLVDDAVSFIAGQFDTWGIFLYGVDVLPSMNSMVTFEYRRDWSISDYPVENGAFQSYDKVSMPYESRVRIIAKSSISDRQLLLTEIEAIAGSLLLYTIVTPERTFKNVNVTHFDIIKRTAQNVGLMIVDLWFIEIRTQTLIDAVVGAVTSFLTTKSPVDSATQSLGNVQSSSPASTFGESGFLGGVT